MSRSALEASFERWKFTLIFSSILGGITGSAGTTLGLLSLLRLLSQYPLLDTLGTVLLVIAFPLLILAAHSLDKAHEAEQAIRVENCRQTGMKESEES